MNTIQLDWPSGRNGTGVASRQDAPEQLAQNLWLEFRARNWDAVRSLLHPEARLQIAVAPGESLDAEEAVARWRLAVAQGSFNPRPVGFVDLGNQRVLVLGPLKPESGVGDADAVVLTFKDGLLWRTHYYDSPQEARSADPDR